VIDGREALSRAERIDRSRARAWALQVHYQWESTGRPGALRDALADAAAMRRISPRRLPYLRRLLTLMDEHLGEVDAAIQGALENWRLERLSTLDRAVLRVGATELLFVDGVPPKVSIQEAIRLAEQYGGPDSPRFVNGVLDALYKGLPEASG
jgi:N utilization substance protein B